MPRTAYEATAARSSNSANASRISARSLSCDVTSTIGRSSAKLRRSPLTAYDRDGNVTLRPGPPPRRSQIENPISFSPASGDWKPTSSVPVDQPRISPV